MIRIGVFGVSFRTRSTLRTAAVEDLNHLKQSLALRRPFHPTALHILGEQRNSGATVLDSQCLDCAGLPGLGTARPDTFYY